MGGRRARAWQLEQLVILFQPDASVERFHTILEIGTPTVLCLLAYIGLLIRASLGEIKLSQAEAKAELIENQTQIKAELDHKHAENTQTIAVHSASDEGHFREIAAALQRGEEAFRRIEARQINGSK